MDTTPPTTDPHTVNKQAFRILLPLDRASARPGLLRIAQMLSSALGGDLVTLHVSTPAHDDDEAGTEVPHARDDLPAWLVHDFRTLEAETVADGILAATEEMDCDLLLLSARGRGETLREQLRQLFDPVIEQARCDVAVLEGDPRSEDGTPSLRRLLVAAKGGTHATAAAELAFSLARHDRLPVTLLTVLPKAATMEEEAEAYQRLRQLAGAAGEVQGKIETRVLRSDQVERMIAEVATGYDLVFIGAPAGTIVDRFLLGSFTERLVTAIPAPVLVVKRYQGPLRVWLSRVWRRVDRFLPHLTAEDRLDVYKAIRRGARGTADYYLLMVLSAVIATMGLLLNSGAVIIGAMLVAPLMSPILALGLGTVLGDTRTLRVALWSTFWGVTLAILVSALLAWIAPLALFTAEVESRTRPNLFDLSVALAAGLAGAYAMSRSRLAAALPGVAIAAALVPPISVVGITLATGRWNAAGGAALLFGTNLIAVALAAGLIFLLLGFRPDRTERHRHALQQRPFLLILLLLFAVSVPLASSLEREVHNVTLDRTLSDALETALADYPTLSLSSFEWTAPPDAPLNIYVEVFTSGDLTQSVLDTLREQVSTAVGREVSLQLIAIQTLDPLAQAGARVPTMTAGTTGALRTPTEAALDAAGGQRLGGSISVVASWDGREQETFLAVIQPFQEATGTSILYERAADLNAVLTRRLERDLAPDLAALPGPGAMEALARAGHLVDINEVVDAEQLEEQYAERWIELGTVDGEMVGFFMRAAVKGLVWYRPEAWEAADYEIPERWDELESLAARMVDDGMAPWCIGLQGGSASGWPGTDWIENILLRQAGPETYTAWVRGEMGWTEPPVREAWETWAALIAQAPDLIFGGRSYIQKASFDQVGEHLFTDPPGCAMHQQASFMSAFYQEHLPELEPGVDYAFFPLPAIESGGAPPLLVGGDLFGMFNDTPPTRALVRYLLTPEAQAIAVSRGGTISPNRRVPLESYPDPVARSAAELLRESGAVHFDASDQMPPILQQSFNEAIIDLVRDPDDLDPILEGLDGVRRADYAVP